MTPSPTAVLCLVCGGEASGIRFEVNACRACAAFFRRSVEIGHKYKCRRGIKRCDVSKEAFLQCRYCRYQKCKDVGMSTGDNVRVKIDRELNAEGPSTSQSTLPTKRLAEFEGHRVKFDESFLMERIMDILSSKFSGPSSADVLQPLLKAYNNMVPGGKSNKIEIAASLDYEISMRGCFENMLRVAKWIMRCREFAELPLGDKHQIYLSMWRPIHILERGARTFEYLGIDCPSSVLLLDDRYAVDSQNYSYTSTSATPEFIKRGIEAWKPVTEQMNRVLLTPIRELALTNFEVVYLCTYRLWELDRVKDLSEETCRIAENVLKRISEELHRYYTTELKMKSYSGRLAEIIRLLNDVDVLVKFTNKIELALDVSEVLGFEFHDSVFCRDNDDDE